MCRSTLTDEQISDLIEGINHRMPKVCPCCKSANIVPTFMDGGDWECLNANCLAWWTPPPGSD